MAACTNPGAENAIGAMVHESELRSIDAKVDSLVGEYVEKFDVDPKKRLILLEVFRDPARTYYYISQSRTKRTFDKSPDYFFVHDSKQIVVIFTGDNSFLSGSPVYKKVELLIEELGVALPNDSLDYNPPVWQVIEDCDKKLRIRSKSDFVFSFLPCGYHVNQDSIQYKNFELVKD